MVVRVVWVQMLVFKKFGVGARTKSVSVRTIAEIMLLRFQFLSGLNGEISIVPSRLGSFGRLA